jgi:membrane-associated protease RseP (regulator of RpoE activity)
VPPTPPSAPRAPRAPEAPNREDDGTVHRKMIINGRELSEDEMDEKMKELDGEHFLSPKDMKDFEELKDGYKDMPGMRGWSSDGGRTFSFDSNGRGRLGVRVEKLSDDLAQALGMSGDEGVLVVQVLEDTPAQKAGIRAGDVIVRIDGEMVSDPDELVKALGSSDGSVDIVLVRKGDRRTIRTELERGATPRAWSTTPAPNARPRRFDVRIPEPGRSPQVYRWRAKDDAENQDLREELRQLRRELQELRREMGERR